jgi:hypothetical protein
MLFTDGIPPPMRVSLDHCAFGGRTRWTALPIIGIVEFYAIPSLNISCDSCKTVLTERAVKL